jgi:hypothetical protein
MIRRRLCLLALAIPVFFEWQPIAARPLSPAQALGALHAHHQPDGALGKHWLVFYDRHCPVCAALYWRTRPAIRAGLLHIWWIPVDLLESTPVLRRPDLAPNTALLRSLSRPRSPVTPSIVAWSADHVPELWQGIPPPSSW